MTDVLIVDDDTRVGETLQEMLDVEGFSSTYCAHPLKAVRTLSEDRFRVLITDMHMPQITGFELLVWANHYYPGLQSLMITGYPSESYEQMVLAGGTARILTKPLKHQELVRQIRLCMLPGMAADINQVQIGDLLQILALSQSAYALELKDSRSGATAWLGLENQQLTYAEWRGPDGHLSGHEACVKALSIRQGSFKERSLRDFKSNLAYPLQDALLLAATAQDESAGKRQACSTILSLSDEPAGLQVLHKILSNQHFSLQQRGLGDSGPLPPGASVLFHLRKRTELATLEAFCRAHPATPVVLLNQSGEPLPGLPLPNLLRSFDHPWPHRELNLFLREFHENGLSGHLADLSLLSQIQMFLMTQQPKRISIKNLSSKIAGMLYLERGRILEAEAGELRGEQAFYTLTQALSGAVIELDWQAPASRSLEGLQPFRLFMQATRHFAELADMKSQIVQKVESLL